MVLDHRRGNSTGLSVLRDGCVTDRWSLTRFWTNVPDFDAVTQLGNSRIRPTIEVVGRYIPIGKYYLMCGMNLAFRRELVPAMYARAVGPNSWRGRSPSWRSIACGPAM